MSDWTDGYKCGFEDSMRVDRGKLTCEYTIESEYDEYFCTRIPHHNGPHMLTTSLNEWKIENQ